MYQNLDITELTSKAQAFIIDNDRMLYRPLFEAAEAFCKSNNVIIGGFVGINMLLERPLDKDDFIWDLYCENGFKTAKSLANLLAKTRASHVDTRTTALQTNIRHKEFTISVLARPLFKIYTLEKYRGTSMINVLKPSVRQGYFTENRLKCLPEEIQLIEIYRNLYSPSKFATWRESIENEKQLFPVIKPSMIAKLGGGASNDKYGKAVERAAKEAQYILIGGSALTKMGFKSSRRPGIISLDPIDAVRERIEEAINATYSVKIIAVGFPIDIPSDFQITKNTLYVKTQTETIPIVDVYNSSSYEMIPYHQIDGFLIGTPWVLLRFLFIEMWMLRIVMNLNNRADLRSIINSMLTSCDELREKIYQDVDKSFQLTDYMGSFISESVAKKKLIIDLGDRLPIYYPIRES